MCGLLTVPRVLLGLALDVLFGKEEPFEYPITGTTPIYDRHLS